MQAGAGVALQCACGHVLSLGSVSSSCRGDFAGLVCACGVEDGFVRHVTAIVQGAQVSYRSKNLTCVGGRMWFHQQQQVAFHCAPHSGVVQLYSRDLAFDLAGQSASLALSRCSIQVGLRCWKSITCLQ